MSYVGQHIGRYRILEELGSGGMSVVYKGLDTSLEREVAVKVLHPHLARKDESRRRLQREARAVAKLNHPNILEVFDFSATDANEAYLVSEYIHGETLRQFAAREPFSPPEVACLIIHEVAAALAHAHDAGILHRDLKPENVMVRSDGVLKLMDFGIAKIIDRDDRMTITGALVGSPAHMAPEIIEGLEAGPEADVFSLGTMLYLFATGRLPFAGANTTATLKQILDGDYEDPRQLVPSVSDELAAILATSLARDPISRYPNAGKLRDALAEYLREMGLEEIPAQVASFFADPASYRKNLVPRLSERLLDRAREMKGQRRAAKALSLLNQTLALEPKNAEAAALLEQMNAADARRRTRRRLAQVALTVAVLGGAGLAAWGAWRRTPARPSTADYLPLGLSGPEVKLPASAFPLKEEPQALPPPGPPATEAKPTTPRPPTGAPAPPKTNRVTLTVKVRPFGWYAVVDSGVKTADVLSQHPPIQLPPGIHKFVVGCPTCVDYEQEREVFADGRAVHLLAQPKPSSLSFEIDPQDSVVRIGEETRSANQTLEHPIQLRAQPGDPVGYRVRYEISHPGYKTVADAVEILAGENKVVRRTLSSQ